MRKVALLAGVVATQGCTVVVKPIDSNAYPFMHACRKTVLRAVAALLTVGTLFGCAAPRTRPVAIDPQRRAQEETLERKLVLERQLRDQARIDRVAWPILLHATSLCGDHLAPELGVEFAVVSGFNKDFRAAAIDLLGLSDEPTLISVIPGSPADSAGLKPGDVIRALGGVTAPTGDKATEKLHKELEAQIKRDGHIAFLIRRNGAEQTVDVRPDVICNYRVLLGPSDEINAFADGEKIVVQKGMLRFVETDVELATVVGHELAHNTMGHMNAQKTNYMLGSIFDIALAVVGVNTQGAIGNAAAGAYSKEFEAEADYVGLYALALADISVDESASFWRRMAAESGANVTTKYNSTHPGSA